MKIIRKGQPVVIGTILSEVLERASAVHEGQVALYVASLQDSRGLAFAMAVHRAASTGPDPAELRARSEEMGAVEPLLAGAARVEVVAAALALLGDAAPPDRHLLAWTVREIHRSGGVPVVMLADGIVLVTTLDTLEHAGDEAELWGWSRPVGEA
jgi:hypothetical protein